MRADLPNIETNFCYNFLKISAGFIRDVRLPMKRLARAPANRESTSAPAASPPDILTGSLTATVAAVAASLAKAGVRFISQGADTGIERNPRQ